MILPFLKGKKLPKGAGTLFTWMPEDLNAPAHIQANLDRARENKLFGPRGSGMSWEEVLYAPPADGTAMTANNVNTIIVPDFSIPASYMVAGKLLKYTVMGRYSSAITTPGTLTHILKWGGVGGVALVTSGAYAPDPTAAATNITWMIEYWVQCRTSGVTGTFMSWARIEWGADHDDASATTLKGNLDMRLAPTATPATVTVDTTIDKLLSVTATHSLGTASIQTHAAVLEAMN